MAKRPNLWNIPTGAPFLPALTDAILENHLLPDLDLSGTRIASATIYVPTRRAARGLRTLFVERMDGAAAILPTIRPLGEFDEEADLLEAGSNTLELPPPVGQHERLFALAPLVRAWKSRLPAHVAALFEEELIVPASAADSIWMARDLAELIDEIEMEGVGWGGLQDLVPAELAGWWQVTLDFLKIVTEYWPDMLAEQERSNPAAWRTEQIDAEARRLRRNPDAGPVIAAGSTGSIPATARLLSAIAHHPAGAVVLPGLDKQLDNDTWSLIGQAEAAPSVFGHPQYGLKKLLSNMDADRAMVTELVSLQEPNAARSWLVSEALRPAETTEMWASKRPQAEACIDTGALDAVAVIEAANEREEALAIAIAMRKAVTEPGRRAALVTGDRNLARRVSAELSRFGVIADDSGGYPLVSTPAATLFQLIAETVFRPGDPAVLLDLLGHPLLRCGMARQDVRRLAPVVELVLLRGQPGRPDIADIVSQFDARLEELLTKSHQPIWFERIDEADVARIRDLIGALGRAVVPLAEMRGKPEFGFSEALLLLVQAAEDAGKDDEGSIAAIYAEDAGEALASVLRSLIAADSDISCSPDEVPDILKALLAPEIVKPSAAGDGRIAIWGVLEARLQSADTLIVGGLNEGSWPRKTETGRFMSRVLTGGIGLEPPERRTGQAAHDFQMAMGAETVVLSRSVRTEGSPASRSRWLQRLLTIAGERATSGLLDRGSEYLHLARAIDETSDVPLAQQPCPKPPLEARPKRFSVTEIETLRRDPYAIYARRTLRLEPLDTLSRDPAAAERGSLFHEILHRFTSAGINLAETEAHQRFLDIAATCFDEAGLPDDIRTVWWPRFVAATPAILEWEREQSSGVRQKHPEITAQRTEVGATRITLSGRADRIDVLDGRQYAEILDYKTGSFPSRKQAHTLLAPQLALEGALLARGAFTDIGKVTPADLKFVRLKPDGSVVAESILKIRESTKTAEALSEEAWTKLEELLACFAEPDHGYRSRALPMREHEMDGDYDHLARALEWSSGTDGGDEA